MNVNPRRVRGTARPWQERSNTDQQSLNSCVCVSERVNHARPEAGGVGAARWVPKQGRRRNRRIAELLERVRPVRDARRQGIQLSALRQAVPIARGNLVRLAVRKIRESRAAQLLVAFPPIGEGGAVRSGLVLADHIYVVDLALQRSQAIDVVGPVLQALIDAAQRETVREAVRDAAFPCLVPAIRCWRAQQSVERLEVLVV